MELGRYRGNIFTEAHSDEQILWHGSCISTRTLRYRLCWDRPRLGARAPCPGTAYAVTTEDGLATTFGEQQIVTDIITNLKVAFVGFIIKVLYYKGLIIEKA